MDWVNSLFSKHIIDEQDKPALIKSFLEKLSKNELKLIPGADKLVQHLYKQGIPMAIATNAEKSQMNGIEKKFGNYFSKYFTHIVCGADDPEVKINKPDPEVYIVCAKRFSNPPKSPQNVLIIEDSLRGITGAVASGMKTLLVNDCKYILLGSMEEKITHIVDSFENFKPESVSLPPYQSYNILDILIYTR